VPASANLLQQPGLDLLGLAHRGLGLAGDLLAHVALAAMSGAGRPRTCDRAIMSRFPAVYRVAPSVILAGQVGSLVRLVASRRPGCPWWNDRENDRLRLPGGLSGLSFCHP
jgi:hypothetical protein